MKVSQVARKLCTAFSNHNSGTIGYLAVTSEESTSSARNAVLTTPELLELIIFHLPARDILTRASRVSRMWARIPKSSPSIREKLFSPPLKSSPAFPSHIFNEEMWTPSWFTGIRNILYQQPVAVNTLLQSHLTRHMDDPYIFGCHFVQDSGKTWVYLNFSITPFSKKAKRRYTQARSSWRDTFLTDPPITMLYMDGYEGPYTDASRYSDDSSASDEDNQNSDPQSSGIVRDRRGITWDCLVDVACDFAGLKDRKVNVGAVSWSHHSDFGKCKTFKTRTDPQEELWRLQSVFEARKNARRAQGDLTEHAAEEN